MNMESLWEYSTSAKKQRWKSDIENHIYIKIKNTAETRDNNTTIGSIVA